jgi:hypothetical protein
MSASNTSTEIGPDIRGRSVNAHMSEYDVRRRRGSEAGLDRRGTRSRRGQARRIVPAQDFRFKKWLGRPCGDDGIGVGQHESRSGRIANRRRKPVLKYGVIVRIETGNLCGFRTREPMMMWKVGMKEPTVMTLRLLVFMNVQKRRLHEGKRQHQIHQNGDTDPHTYIVPFRGPEGT